ncbi:hypothetical protein MP228_010503 [Amoeboaphelidium protococcarum]|nr:hypothetical protein MP228_010503 [Amoeboaphelidium protococcarum]
MMMLKQSSLLLVSAGNGVKLLQYSQKRFKSIGIRREDKGKWERRSPLTPQAVSELSKHSQVLIQPCNKRIFTDQEYSKAGAIVKDDLSEADLILGIKEVPTKQLIPNKQYMFFSHTHKGQKHNMPLLKSVLEKNIHLMDYELLVDQQQRRLVAFGQYAGYAGMIDILHGLGLKLLSHGYNTPFVNISRAYNHYELKQAEEQVAAAGRLIASGGLSKDFGPLTFMFTGAGNVTKGALQIFQKLPHQMITLDQLLKTGADQLKSDKIYGVMLKPEDYLVNTQGKRFDLQDYLTQGTKAYRSVFHEKVVPQTSVLVNGAYWDENYPRLLTNDQLHQLQKSTPLKMLAVADISCDISGPLEFMDHASTIDEPFFTVDASKPTIKQTPGIGKDGFTVMSIDNLPAEMPFEATKHFSTHLTPLLMEYLQKGSNKVMQNATIAQNGKLLSRFYNLKPLVDSALSIKVNKKALILGSGRVCAPVIDYLQQQGNVDITIASNNQEEAHRLVQPYKNVQIAGLDVSNAKELHDLVHRHDIAISLVPAMFHPQVLDACISAKRNMVTASYLSPQIESKRGEIDQAGISVLNEVGLDPGIDHLLAMEFFDSVKTQGYKITSFKSVCGGLPAPECSDNPFGYKFSWSPRGVLLAALNPAQYRMDGELVKIGEGGSILDYAEGIELYKGFNLEVLPNRDSMKYIKTYGLVDSDLDTMFRGTLRFRGFSELMRGVRDLGMLDIQNRLPSSVQDWTSFWDHCLKSADAQSLDQLFVNKIHDNQRVAVVDAFKWLGLFNNDLKIKNRNSKLDALCEVLEQKLKYQEGERDLVILHHDFTIQKGDSAKERHTISMIEYGDPAGHTAMAKTVGIPAAIGANLILNNGLRDQGILLPTMKSVYQPMLRDLIKQNVLHIKRQKFQI